MKFTKCTTIIFATVLFSGVVMADSETDSRIKDAAKQSYNYRTVLENKVSISVKDGVVTLTGTVQDPDLKSLAEDTVKDLPGVVAVNNQINVSSPAPQESDGWIAFKIHWLLLTRSNVSATATTVDVKDGAVTLSGNVDNTAQKDLTEVYVKQVKGVKSVTNNLVVKVPSVGSEGVSDYIDDASITTQVKYALHANSAVTPQPSVTTSYGVVVITGEASNDAEKALVTQIAQSVRGVKSISNNLIVKNS